MYKQGVGVYGNLSESDSTCLTIFTLGDCFPPPLFQASATGGQTQNAPGFETTSVKAALLYHEIHCVLDAHDYPLQ